MKENYKTQEKIYDAEVLRVQHLMKISLSRFLLKQEEQLPSLP